MGEEVVEAVSDDKVEQLCTDDRKNEEEKAVDRFEGEKSQKKQISARKRQRFNEMKQKRKDKDTKRPKRDDGKEEGQKRSITGKQAYQLLMKHRSEVMAQTKECNLRKENFLTLRMPPTKEDCPFSCSIRQFVSGKTMRHAQPGHPLVVIVAQSARRAVEIMKPLSLTLKHRICKLFAKHLKVEDQVGDLKEKYPIAIGTPSRLMKLHDLGALSFTKTLLLLIDGKFNGKNVALYNDPSETVKVDFFSFLDAFVADNQGGEGKSRIGIVQDALDEL